MKERSQYPGLDQNDPLFSFLFNESSDGLLILYNGKIIDCNQKTVELFRANDKKDLIGKTPWDISPEYQHDGQNSEKEAKKVIEIALKGKDASLVTNALIHRMNKLPKTQKRTLTWDRGMELAYHKQVTLSTNMSVYFCDPKSPWQRGLNENTNGLLR